MNGEKYVNLNKMYMCTISIVLVNHWYHLLMSLMLQL